MTPDPTLRTGAIAALKQWQGVGAYESAHQAADRVLCDLLSALGYGDVVEEWPRVGRWYA